MKKAELKRHKTGKWEYQSIARLKQALKKAEHERLCKENPANPPKLDEVNTVVPLSAKMQEWMPIQWEIYKSKKGQVHESPEEA